MENVIWPEIWQATLDTLYMIGISTFFATLIGLPIGVVLFLTSQGQLLANRVVYVILSLVVNILRSIPFVILIILLIPTTRILVGTTLGVAGTLPSLIIGAAPFFARLVETAIREVDRGVIEAAQSMGATGWQVVWKVLLPEARPGIISAITITAVALVSYTAMSGVLGGGGLGDLAIRYGYQRFQEDVMYVTVIILIVMVQILQMFGDRLVLRFIRK